MGARTTIALAAALLAGGCGGSDQRFTAEGFVAAVNEHGAELVLGGPLPYPREDAELHSVTFEEAEDHAGHAHGSGTLAVFPEDSAALAEHERCSATTLQCYRAANVMLSYVEAHPVELERLAAAFEGLAAQ
jgi:hypothetical protein